MGQRLNIEIVNNSRQVLANCYYHWGGFTLDSLYLTKTIIDFIKNESIDINCDNIFKIKYAIRILKSTGAGFSRTDWEEAKKLNLVEGDYINNNCDRVSGYISVDEKGIMTTRGCSEGIIIINIQNNTFYFDCAKRIERLDDEEDEDIIARIKDLFVEVENLDKPYAISFDKIDNIIKAVELAEKNYNGRFRIKNILYKSIY